MSDFSGYKGTVVWPSHREKPEKESFFIRNNETHVILFLVLLCILKYNARLCFSIKFFHRNLALWNFPARITFVPLNTAMAQSLRMFNCILFHWPQWCLLFKVIKNLHWNPDEAHMDRPHPAGGDGEPCLTCAANAGTELWVQSHYIITHIHICFPLLLNRDPIRPVCSNPFDQTLVFTLGWDEWCHRF